MGERGPRPETAGNPVLSAEYADLTDPRAYIETAREGLAKLRQLFTSVEK